MIWCIYLQSVVGRDLSFFCLKRWVWWADYYGCSFIVIICHDCVGLRRRLSLWKRENKPRPLTTVWLTWGWNLKTNCWSHPRMTFHPALCTPLCHTRFVDPRFNVGVKFFEYCLNMLSYASTFLACGILIFINSRPRESQTPKAQNNRKIGFGSSGRPSNKQSLIIVYFFT